MRSYAATWHNGTMTEHKTFPGKVYAVTSAAGCTVTDPSGLTIATVEAGEQKAVVATSDRIFTSADATVTAVFKYAPAKLWALGLFGRGDALPIGYLPALFLESTGNGERINPEIDVTTDSLELTFQRTDKSWNYQFGNGVAYWDEGAFHINVTPSWANSYYAARVVANMYGAGTVSAPNSSGLKKITAGTDLVNGVVFCGAVSAAITNMPTKNAPFYLFALWDNGKSEFPAVAPGRIFRFTARGTKFREMIPCISAGGSACLYDKALKRPFYNSGEGAFIVGMTAAQARKLGNLPEGGGTLTISLPSEVVDENGVLQDIAIFTALSAAAAKGWSFILQTHDGTAVETEVPAGYMECEFLESTGTQYLNITFASSESVTSTIDYQWVNVSGRQLTGYNHVGSLFFGVNEQKPNGWDETNRWANFSPLDRHKFVFFANATNFGSYVSLNGEKITRANDEPLTCPTAFSLFSFKGVFKCYARCFSFSANENNEIISNCGAAITPEGVPCMWDKVSGEAKLNAGTGSFVCGMTAAQAVQLANLPSGGGELTVSLPQSILNDEGEITDAAVNAALNKAADNGWTITLQYYTES